MINYNVDSDGIATITWDMPGRSMNMLNEASMTAYAGALESGTENEHAGHSDGGTVAEDTENAALEHDPVFNEVIERQHPEQKQHTQRRESDDIRRGPFAEKRKHHHHKDRIDRDDGNVEIGEKRLEPVYHHFAP